jgi:hypothetical protein
MKMLVTKLGLIAIVTLAPPATGQDRPQAHDLYANRDGKAFSFERSYPSLAACDAAARSLYASKQVLGAGCKPATPTPTGAEPHRRAETEEQKAGTRERPRQ